MVKRLASGDAVVLEAEAAALGDAASNKAVDLLRKAKSFYHDAQVEAADKEEASEGRGEEPLPKTSHH